MKYQPKIQLVFEDAAKPGWLRQRLCISLQWEGKDLSLYGFLQELQKKIDMTAALLEEKDRDLFENILAETISHKLRARIEESQQWARNMTSLMGTLKTCLLYTSFPEKMKVVAVADLDPRKVEKARQLYDIPQENCFSSAEEMLEQEKLADVMVVSTMDRQHVGHAIPALRRGYNLSLIHI